MNLSRTPKIGSLKNRSEIQVLLASGEKVYTKYGLIFLKDLSDSSKTNIAILVKKKTGNAVHRNYVKRLIRNFIRNHAEKICFKNRIAFLYLFQGKIEYNNLEEAYLKAFIKYEENLSNSH